MFEERQKRFLLAVGLVFLVMAATVAFLPARPPAPAPEPLFKVGDIRSVSKIIPWADGRRAVSTGGGNPSSWFFTQRLKVLEVEDSLVNVRNLDLPGIADCWIKASALTPSPSPAQ